MGGLMSSAMEESFKKNKEFMIENQKVMLERQLQMQNQMREKGMAMQLAGSREMLNWTGSFYAIASLAMILGFSKTKNPGVLVPILPLSFIVGYQYDWSYGTKVERIRADAEKILQEERGKVSLPLGMPTFASIDGARLAAIEQSSKESSE